MIVSEADCHKQNAHLSTVSEKQVQTVVLAVSVVQFHMTTKLNFMLVKLSTSKTSKYLQKNFWNKHRRQCYFWYMSWFNLPIHHQVSKLLPPRHCWDSRFRKKKLQWIQLSERRQNASPVSIRTLTGTREDILHGAGHSANSLLNPPKDCFLGQYSTLAIFLAQVLL